MRDSPQAESLTERFFFGTPAALPGNLKKMMIAVAGGLLLSSCSANAGIDPKRDAVLPGILDLSAATTPEQVQQAYYDYIWKSFIALNWPNQKLVVSADGKTITTGFRGVPDKQRNILDQTGRRPDEMVLSVWETYKEPGEIFLPPSGWVDYPSWNSPRPQSGARESQSRHLMQYSRNFGEYATDLNQPYFFDQATGPLVDRNGKLVRYEVAVNESFFEYVRHFRYYDASRQMADVRYTIEHPVNPPPQPLAARPGFQRPPHGGEDYLIKSSFPDQGLVDLKAAWRVLGPKDDPTRYLHRRIVVDADGRSELMGLVALHVLRFICIRTSDPVASTTAKNTACKDDSAPGYIASTFEQVDNVSVDEQASAQGIVPTFNDGSAPNPVELEYGFDYSIPPLASNTSPRPQAPMNIYRASSQALSNTIRATNQRYRSMLKPSVFQFYRLIGTQNKHPGTTIGSKPSDLNGHQGPITGVYTNSNNLVNSALESYTQKNFSCILCHVRARPQGVPEKAWEEDYFKTLTFLLQSAHSPYDE